MPGIEAGGGDVQDKRVLFSVTIAPAPYHLLSVKKIIPHSSGNKPLSEQIESAPLGGLMPGAVGPLSPTLTLL